MRVDQVIRDERKTLQMVLRALDKNLTFRDNFTPSEATVQAAPGANVSTYSPTNSSPYGFQSAEQMSDLIERVNELNVLVKELRAIVVEQGLAT